MASSRRSCLVFFIARGLTPADVGFLFAAGTIVRIVAGPIAGYCADRTRTPRAVFGCAAFLAGIVSFAYLGGSGFWYIFLIAMLHAVAIASLAPLADAITLAVAARARTFQYGWVRGAGSAAFIAGTLTAGQLIENAGLASIIVASGVMFLATSATGLIVPTVRDTKRPAESGLAAARLLVSSPAFRRITLVSALVMGSHSLNDTFAVVRWDEAGIGPSGASLLWSIAVLSEVVVFLFAGPRMLDRLGPSCSAMLAAAAGVARWAVMATTASLPMAAIAQMGHGLTFSLMHLTAMRIIAEAVPARLLATAQTIYGTCALGIASAFLTAGSGALYGSVGPAAFWAMAALCVLALPLAAHLRPFRYPVG